METLDFFLKAGYPPLLNIKQLSEIIGLSPGTIRNQLAAGTCAVRVMKIGTRRMVDLREVARYVNEHNVNSNIKSSRRGRPKKFEHIRRKNAGVL